MPEPFKSHTICPECVVKRIIKKNSDRPQTSKVKADNKKLDKIPCLSCREDFLSEGNHNRRCDPCRRYS